MVMAPGAAFCALYSTDEFKHAKAEAAKIQ